MKTYPVRLSRAVLTLLGTPVAVLVPVTGLTAIASPTPIAPSELASPLAVAVGSPIAPAAIPQSQDFSPAATTVADWLAQGQGETLTVTGITIERTDEGLEIALITADDHPLAIDANQFRAEGNALVAEIPHAVLALAEGPEFTVDNPSEDIAQIQVTQLEGDRIQITVTGNDAQPSTEVVLKTGLLVYVLNPVEGTTAATDIPATDIPEEEVVVTATRTAERLPDIPRSVTVIDRAQLDQQEQVARDLQDILGKAVPGLSSPRQQLYGPTLRGRNPLILIDGVPAGGNFTTGFVRDWRSIDTGAIERIEVVRGPSAIYGDGATGGVINIITRRPSEIFSATTNAGMTFALTGKGDGVGLNLRQLVSDTEGKFDYTLSAGLDLVGDYFDAEGDRIPLFDYGNSNSETFNLFAKLGFNPTEDQRFQLTVNHYNDQQSYRHIFDTNVSADPDADKALALRVGRLEFIDTPGPGNIATLASLTYNHDNFLNGRLGLQAYYRDTVNRGAFYDFRPFAEEAIFPIGRSVQSSERFGARLQLETPLLGRLSEPNSLALLWGVDYSNEDITERTDDFDLDTFVESGQRVLRKFNERFSSPEFNVENLGLFGQLKWDINDRFILTGGIRQEFYEVSLPSFIQIDDIDASENSITGGDRTADGTAFNAGIVYKATPELSVYANFAQGFSLPDIARLLRRPPAGFNFERDLELSSPVKVNNYELGLRGQWQDIQFSLAGFYAESNLGASVVFDDPARPGRLARAPRRDYGVEAAIDWQIDKTWQIGGTYTWIEGEDDIDEDGEFLAINSFEIEPPKLTFYVQHQTAPGWLNRLQMLYVGDRDRAFEDGVDGRPIDSYLIFDFISSLKLGPGTLFLGIENLFNNQYSTVTSQYIGGFDSSVLFAGRGRTLSVNYQVEW